jgi:hypothetical protein
MSERRRSENAVRDVGVKVAGSGKGREDSRSDDSRGGGFKIDGNRSDGRRSR